MANWISPTCDARCDSLPTRSGCPAYWAHHTRRWNTSTIKEAGMWWGGWSCKSFTLSTPMEPDLNVTLKRKIRFQTCILAFQVDFRGCTVYMHKNAFPAWNSVRPRSTFSESWVNWRLWSISVSLWDEMGTSADQMKQDWMKLLLLDEFDTSHKFLQRKVTKPSKLFGRNNGYSFDTSEWIFPMMASNQTRCSKYLWHWKLRWVKCRW